MSMQLVRSSYNVPARRGARVRYAFTRGRRPEGTVVGASNYLHVRFDGDVRTHRIHPTDDALEWLLPQPTSAKEAVRQVHPNAYAWKWADCWTIYATRPGDRHHSGQSLGRGATAALAWANAAAQLSPTV